MTTCENSLKSLKSNMKIGINHPVAKVSEWREITVTEEEYRLVIAYRKMNAEYMEAFKRGECF